MKFPLSPLLRGILVFFQISLCNLTLYSFQKTTCFERLNEWYSADLGLPEFLVLYALRRSNDTRYYLQTRANLRWKPYITELPGQDNDWYRDILLVTTSFEWLPIKTLERSMCWATINYIYSQQTSKISNRKNDSLFSSFFRVGQNLKQFPFFSSFFFFFSFPFLLAFFALCKRNFIKRKTKQTDSTRGPGFAKN